MKTGLINLDELGALLYRSPETLKKDLKRNPSAIPRGVNIPGTCLLRWRQVDIGNRRAGHMGRLGENPK